MGMLVIALPMEYTMSAGYRSGGEVSSTHGILLTIDYYYPVSIMTQRVGAIFAA